MLPKELKGATGVYKKDSFFNLAAKKNSFALKSEGGKLDINKLINFPTSLDDLKSKVGDLVLVSC